MVSISSQSPSTSKDSPRRTTTATEKVPQIFNHDIMTCTADGVVGNELYSGRALGITSKEDIIQLSPKLKSEWKAILNHYGHIGLSHTRHVIWDTDLNHIQARHGYRPSVFFFGDQESKIHNNPAWAEVVTLTNSKNSFMSLADELGVPVPNTQCFDRAENITSEMADGFSYPCYLKASISVSGAGIFRCTSAAQLMQSVATFAPETPVQVQEEVVTDCFLNMQYQVSEGKCKRLLVTEQILEGTAHQGNVFPARHTPWDVVEPMAKWMAQHGFNDIFAFDVAVIEKDGKTSFLAIECNPRFNGASYPTAIALKLKIRQWSSLNVSTRHRHLADINLSGLEYNPLTGEGIIIVNWGPVLAGKLMVMLAGPQNIRQELEKELVKRLW